MGNYWDASQLGSKVVVVVEFDSAAAAASKVEPYSASADAVASAARIGCLECLQVMDFDCTECCRETAVEPYSFGLKAACSEVDTAS